MQVSNFLSFSGFNEIYLHSYIAGHKVLEGHVRATGIRVARAKLRASVNGVKIVHLAHLEGSFAGVCIRCWLLFQCGT